MRALQRKRLNLRHHGPHSGAKSGRISRIRPVEALEPRLLLYAPNGGVWVHPELVTVSFMPDGTDIGGVPSNLFSALDSRMPTATWQKEMLRGVQSFAANANLNVSLASDDGSPFGSCGNSGSDCNLQGDANFGDIRVGGLDLGGSLGLAMLPPPINGDTTAGDFFLDTTANWNVGLTFDINTVSSHEAGHSLGLDHSALSTAVMFANYLGVKMELTADDIAGIQSIYGARPADSFDAASSNNVKSDATVITSYIDSNKQITLNNLDLTNASDDDWYKITTPSGTSGTMVVQVQTTGLSLMAPKLTVYKGSTLKGTVSGGYNSTISISNSIGNGQNWFIKVEAAESSVFGIGKYALQVNMGTSALPPVAIPNTSTPVTGPGGNGSPMLHDHAGESDHAGSDQHSGTNDQADESVIAPSSHKWQSGTRSNGSTSGAITETPARKRHRDQAVSPQSVVYGRSVVSSVRHVPAVQAELVDAVLAGTLV